MTKLRLLDLFSGIGGFSLGLERSGLCETVAFCEIEPFPRKVLAKNWPGVKIYEDVRTLTRCNLDDDGITVDIICGGFPCQDISTAGKGEGIAGQRSGLWSEIARLVCELRPKFLIVENVSALLGRGMGTVLGDLAKIGYDAEWHCIPAFNVGAPHRRDRVWIVAYPKCERRAEMALFNFTNDGLVENSGWQTINAGPLVGACSWTDWEKQSGICLVGDGFPDGVARCRAAGNAVVPQIPELIGRAILRSLEAS